MTDLAWTSKENIAIELIFELLKETRFNRTLHEYCEIDKQLPTIEAAFVHVNSRLAQLAKSGRAPYEICYFKQGDRGHFYEPFPTSLSRETIRKAIRKYRDQVAVARQLVSH
ncbi:hypothetical protein [Bradyrhizobium sp. AUGA SZCCT0283]|uniref:hypothetical protein n=1 Tax=Bradyrhizobium sp. AUGA SZCCT0283 TaxID=2807671 RepID=UPI001BA85A5E|nr:hypothetical protein [Bradyrhizobium sp. AUGA SZCCT0283]MBR1276092.1 hypothetical protein [Bradyrhizobium sp. AUGA SZCCT0283]